MTLTLTGVSANSITYNVTRNVPATALANIRCTLAGYQMLASSLVTPTVTRVNWSQSSSGIVVDTLRWQDAGSPSSAKTVHYADTQFEADGAASNARLIRALGSSTSYGAQQRWVDTSSANATTGTTNGTADNTAATSAAFTVAATSTGATLGVVGVTTSTINAAAATLTITYTGDFSFLDNDGNGCTVGDLTTGWARLALGGGGTASINSACTVITTTGVGDRTDTLTFSVANTSGDSGLTASNNSSLIGAKAINAQSISTLATWSDATGVLGTARPIVYPLSMSLNAWSNDIPYMPYGPGISRILYITNRSSTAGVAISAVNEAGVSCPSTSFPAVSARGSSVTSISAAADAGVASCYGADYNGKVRFTVTVNVSPQTRDTIRLNVASTNAVTGTYAATVSSCTVLAATTATCVKAATVGAGLDLAASVTQSAGNVALGGQNGTVDRQRSVIDIYSAYNVNGNRVTVINPSNGR